MKITHTYICVYYTTYLDFSILSGVIFWAHKDGEMGRVDVKYVKQNKTVFAYNYAFVLSLGPTPPQFVFYPIWIIDELKSLEN